MEEQCYAPPKMGQSDRKEIHILNHLRLNNYNYTTHISDGDEGINNETFYSIILALYTGK